MSAASAQAAAWVSAVGLLPLCWSTAKALKTPVDVGVDRIEERFAAAVGGGGGSRRLTMSAAAVAELSRDNASASQRLLRFWVLASLLSWLAQCGVPYAAEARAALVLLAVLEPAAKRGGGGGRTWLDAAFLAVAPPLLGRAVPRLLRCARRQARGALWFVAPAARGVAGALAPRAAIGLLRDAGA